MPRFGELLPADVWAAVTRTLTNPSGVWSDATRTLTNPSGVWSDATPVLTDFSAQDLFDLPIMDSTYQVAGISSAASADAFGSWVELVADVGSGKRLLYVVVFCRATGVVNVECELGEGAAASEVAVARVQAALNVNELIVIPVFRSLTDSARLSARIRDENAGAINYTVKVMIA